MLKGSSYREIVSGRWRTVYQFVCDQCGCSYDKEEKRDRREKPTHYCTLDCANAAQISDGVLDNVRRVLFVQRLGVDYPQQSSVVRKKSEQTCMTRYGVTNVQQVPDIKQRSCDTFLKRLEKRQRTLGVWSSKAETAFYQQLLEHFHSDDIVRQKRVPGTRRPIDFYIKSINVYVQFDGVYWHGLDRPLEEIEQCITKHDQEISQRWYRDREQDEWFRQKGLKLVRVTDVEFDSMSFDTIIERIR